jgi:hypothetical protein
MFAVPPQLLTHPVTLLFAYNIYTIMQPSAALCAALVAFFGLSPAAALPANVDPRNVIVRDVAIIGGGSSGIHAAIQLKDAGKSIIVVESKSLVGGHTNTYTDRATGIPADYGVAIWHNTSTVSEYFNRFNVPLTRAAAIFNSQPLPFDYGTGSIVNVPAAARPSQQAIGEALQKYVAFLMKYPQLAGGMFLPRPVPQELSMPFGQLAKQLGIEAAVPTLIQFNPATGDASTLPTAEFIRVAGLELVQQIVNQSFVTSARGNNSEIYGKAQAELLQAQSLLLSSQVISSQRRDNGVEIAVKTPQGIKYICAKKLIITIPPRLENLTPFNPTQNERSVFSKWLNAGYYNCIVKNTGLPPTTVISTNLRNPFAQGNDPGIVLASPNTIPGHSNVYYSTPRSTAQFPLSIDVVKARILAELKRAQAVNQSNRNFTQTQPEFVVCQSHSPFYLQVTSEDIASGFYDRMNALQGQKSTYWTGAAWRGQDSTAIWNFNKQVLLPMVMQGL